MQLAGLSASGRRAAGWAGLAYLAVACTVLSPQWADPGRAVTGGSDAYLFVWFLGWTPHALAHGLNPFMSHALLGGGPANLMWNTSVPVLAALAAPVTATLGPVVSLTVLSTLAVAVNGLVAFVVLRRWAAPVAAFLGGLFFSVCPFVMGAELGHLHLAFAPLLWVMLAIGDDLMVRRRPPVRCGVLLGLVVAAQALISEELLTLAALAALLMVAVLAALRPAEVAARWRGVVAGVAVAAGVATLLLAYPLWVQFRGAGRVTGAFPNIGRAVADAYGTFTPAPLQRLRPYGRGVARQFLTNGTESTSYLGIPLILFCVFVASRLRRDLLVIVSSIGLVVVTVLSFGAHLVAGGHDTGLLMPWRVASQLPLLDNVITVRLSLLATIFAALLLARGLTAVQRQARWRLAMPVLAILLLAPLLPITLPTSRFDTPAFFTRAADRHLVAAGRPVLVVPYPTSGDAIAMAWQATGGYRMTMYGGYIAVPGLGGRPRFGPARNRLEAALVDGERGRLGSWTPTDVQRWQADLAGMAPRLVVLGPVRHHEQLDTLLDAVTGRDGTPLDGVEVWR